MPDPDPTKRMTELRTLIATDRALRDAQTYGGGHYEYFQARINARTAELRAWERNRPRLREIEQEIRNHEQQCRAQAHAAEHPTSVHAGYDRAATDTRAGSRTARTADRAISGVSDTTARLHRTWRRGRRHWPGRMYRGWWVCE